MERLPRVESDVPTLITCGTRGHVGSGVCILVLRINPGPTLRPDLVILITRLERALFLPCTLS
jgi:hypothetical protein